MPWSIRAKSVMSISDIDAQLRRATRGAPTLTGPAENSPFRAEGLRAPRGRLGHEPHARPQRDAVDGEVSGRRLLAGLGGDLATFGAAGDNNLRVFHGHRSRVRSPAHPAIFSSRRLLVRRIEAAT